MSKVIDFLQALGDGSATTAEAGLVAAVDALGVDDAMRQALINRDQDAINLILGGRQNVFCLLVPAEEDDKQQDDEPDRDDNDKEENIRAA
ncbi:hypothetical protein [Arenimonas aestuarii]